MDILARINWVDVLIIIIMFRMSYVAFQDGLSHEIFPLIASICTVTLGIRYYERLAAFLSRHAFNMPIDWASFLSFTTLVIGISIVFKLIRAVLDKIVKVAWHPAIEKFGGLVFGIIRASIVTSVILIILALLPMSYLTWSIKDRSLTGIYFLRIGPAIYESASKFLPGVRPAGSSAESGALKMLISEKSMSKPKKEQKTKTPDWEKALQ